uniref:ribonuclease H n=1 Tax=Graphocephala atropunctata TaxID=36148 RepID=A0A1B6KR96_9HEMI
MKYSEDLCLGLVFLYTVTLSPILKLWPLGFCYQQTFCLKFSNLTNENIEFHTESEKYNMSKKHTTPTFIKQYYEERTNLTYKAYTQIYTDGSKNTDGVGSAFYIPALNVKKKFKLNKHMSSYSAELYAIYMSMKYINTLSDHQFVIFTDSQAAVRAVDNSIKGSRGDGIVINIIEEIQKSSKRIILHWIPGHCGIVQNETADKLAKEAIYEEEIHQILHVPSDDFKAYQNKRYIDLFNNKITQSTKARWYINIQGSTTKQPWFTNSRFKRCETINICRIRYGHGTVNSYLHRIGQYFTPLCLNCTLGKPETLEHLLLECPNFEYARTQAFNKIKTIWSKLTDQKLTQLMKLNDLEIYKEINKYLVYIKKQI